MSPGCRVLRTAGATADLAAALGQLAWRRSGSPGGVILAYHDVVAGPSHLTKWAVTAAQLRGHVRLLRRLGFQIVPLAEVVERLRPGAAVPRLAALTFDDALLGVHRHGLPVLLEEAAPATVLPVSARLGVAPPWWPGAQRAMTAAELSEVVDAGLDVAGHSRTHPSLPTLTDAALVAELGGARRELEDLLGRPVNLLAYPYGHHDERVARTAAEVGYQAACTFLNGRVLGGELPHRLPRLTMGPHLGRLRLAYHLARPAASWPDHQVPAVSGGRTP